MTRWPLAAAGALVLAASLVAPASGAHWPLTGGDPSRSGLQSTDGGQPPIVPAWSRADAGIRTPLVITGGAGSGVQRVAYGTTAGAVHLQVLESGTPVGPEEGIALIDSTVEPDLHDTFGDGTNATGFADTSTEDRLGLLLVPHNDGTGIDVARIDLATGTRLDRPDFAIPNSAGCEVNGSPVLTPAAPDGSRLLYVAMIGAAAACDRQLVRIPLRGDGLFTQGGADPPITYARVDTMTPGASPSLVVLPDDQGNPRYYVAVSRRGGVEFYDAGRAFFLTPNATGTKGDETAALNATEDVMTVSAPATAEGLVAGGSGSGAPPAPAVYAAADAAGTTRLHRLVRRNGTVEAASSVVLAASGRPAPAMAVDEVVTPSGVSSGGRLVVSSSANLHVVRTGDLGEVARLSPVALAAGKGFSRQVPALASGRVHISRDGAADAPAEHLVLGLGSLTPLSATDFTPAAAMAAGEGAGQPAIARGFVVFGSPASAVAYRTRDAGAPTVELLEPADGARLEGTATLAARASDSRGIASVDFRLISEAGGVRVVGRTSTAESGSPFSPSAARYAVSFATGTVPEGTYEIEAVAFDPTGNATTSPRRRISSVPTPLGDRPGACKNELVGTRRDDRLRGSALGDKIRGGRGNDRISGLGGDDCLLGEGGHDILEGGEGNDQLTGRSGRDVLRGGPGADRVSGGSSRDRLAGDAGNDRVIGGSGNDVLRGGSGRNRLLGGGGNDVIRADNGTRDTVNCGRGRDRVTADRSDRVSRSCERVRRVRRVRRA